MTGLAYVCSPCRALSTSSAAVGSANIRRATCSPQSSRHPQSTLGDHLWRRGGVTARFAHPFDECCGGDSGGSIRIAPGGQLAAGDECVDTGDRQTQPAGRLGQGESGPPVHPRHRYHCARHGPRGPGTFARATARAGWRGCRQLLARPARGPLPGRRRRTQPRPAVERPIRGALRSRRVGPASRAPRERRRAPPCARAPSATPPATGISDRGTPMVCAPAADGRNRWKRA